VFEKLPAFLACAAWIGASGLELPLEQPASERLRAVARRVLGSSETEQVFIFMATDWPLGNVAKLTGVAAGVLSSDVALYHTRSAVGNWGYFGGYLRRAHAGIG
jgi:hypothetical protein